MTTDQDLHKFARKHAPALAQHSADLVRCVIEKSMTGILELAAEMKLEMETLREERDRLKKESEELREALEHILTYDSSGLGAIGEALARRAIRSKE